MTVTLLDSTGAEIATTVTDSNGGFTFDNFPAGNYTVVESNLPEYINVSDNGGIPLDDLIPVVIRGGTNTSGLLFIDKIPTRSPTLAPTPGPTSSPTPAPTPVPLGSLSGKVSDETTGDTIGDIGIDRKSVV